MKLIIRVVLIFQILTIISCQDNEKKVENKIENILWYKQPAANWMQALPVGNGRLGAMVFGDAQHERIQLNEDSMWSGGPDWGNSKGNSKDLKELRKLIADGKVHEADAFIIEKFSYGSVKKSHQTMGDLFIDFEERKIKEYTRSLNLNKALATVNYTADGAKVTEKVFASKPGNVLMIQLETEDENGMNFKLKLDRPMDNGHKTVQVSSAVKNEITMEGMVTQFKGVKDSKPIIVDYGVKFQTKLKVKNIGGTVTSKDGQLYLKGVKKATIYLVCESSFYKKEYAKAANEHLNKISQKSFESLLQEHQEDFSKLFDRTTLNLGGKVLDSLPTNLRLKKLKEGGKDVDLVAKLFEYGRYLLISSSRPGTNPANLQGIWNKDIQAPWNADYHLNINLQMNYWPAEVTNLNECHQPLFDFIDRLIERGRITAKEQYNCRGAVVHHTSDLWASTWMRASQPYWGAWVHGGGWIVQHYWEAYQFNKDTKFLKERAYPAIKACAEFYLDWLVKDPKSNTWVSSPSTSPENSYIALDGKPAAVSQGDAMSHQIIAEVFDNYLASAVILNINDSFVEAVKKKRKTLRSGFQIGSDGRLLEWDQSYEEAEKGHRHMSHLYGLHPGNDITSKTPKLFDAAKKTIAYRLEHGGAGTGWSRVWMINFNARLFNPKAAQENISKFLKRSVADNLFDMHPPFQIDGNFGFTAGVAELLLQSHEGFLRVLPTLPKDWSHGSVKGLKARAGITVAIEWNAEGLKVLKLSSAMDQKKEIVYLDKKVTVELKKGKEYRFDTNLKSLQ